MNSSGITLRSVAGTKLTLSIGDGRISSGARVYRVTGREAISKPFRYEVELILTGVDALGNPRVLSSSAVLGKRATLEIEVADVDSAIPVQVPMPAREMVRRVHGVVDELIVEETVDDDNKTERHYRLVLVPRLAMLARNRQNRIHSTAAPPQTLEEIITHKLLSSGPDYGPYESRDRVVLENDDFHFDIDNTKVPLASLSHVAQYEETDLDFLRRLCERHGVYFFFASNAGDSSDAEDTRGVVVFANNNAPFGVIRFETGAGGSRYREEHRLDIELTLTGATGLTGGSTFTPAGGGPARLEGVLFEFRSVHRPTPANLRMATADGQAGAPPMVTVDGTRLGIHTARGIHTDYDTHFRTRAAGAAFVDIRSQELKVANNYFVGSTSSPCVAPGRTFTKIPPEGRFAGAREYLVTAIDIEVTQAHEGLVADIDGEAIRTEFGNRFRCIAFDGDAQTPTETKCVFRPPRETPVPRVPGVQTAYIGTGNKGEAGRPELDAEGRYRIYSQVVDERTRLVGPGVERIDSLSKAVRKGEPYAGDDVGMHFALKRDTEVLVAYRNGDPDRPVIAAAMPGPLDHESPVTDENPTSHVVRTSSGARFEIHDDYRDADGEDSGSRVALRSRSADDKASYVRLGAADSANGSDSGTLEDYYETNVITVEKDKRDGIALYSADNIREATRKDRITEAQGSVRVEAGKEIHGRSVEKHLLRGRPMVIVSGDVKNEPGEGTELDIGDEELSVGDDDMLLSSKGNVYLEADGDLHTTALKSVTTDVAEDEVRTTSGDTVAHHFGSTSRYVRGYTQKFVLGGDFSHTVGASALGRLGGWLAILGGAGGIPYYGAGIFLWPQVHFFHSVVMCSTVTIVDVKNKSCTTDTTRKYALRHRYWALFSAIADARISSCSACCAGTYTEL